MPGPQRRRNPVPESPRICAVDSDLGDSSQLDSGRLDSHFDTPAPRRAGRSARALLAGLLSVALTAVHAAPQLRLYAVALHNQPAGDFVSVLEDASTYYARAADLDAWRITPHGPARQFDGSDWYPLSAAHPRLDTPTQTLHLYPAASDFATQRIDLRAAPRAADPAPLLPGFTVDYDLSVEHATTAHSAGALLDAGAFGLAGLPGTLQQRLVVQDRPGSASLLRLDSVWRHADPATLRTTTLGDSVTCNGELGGTARFGGVQMQRDFSLRPDLIPYPLPTLGGSADVPSALDLLIDGRRSQVALDSGPFQLDNPPVLAGAGEINVVQRDVLGRETRLAVPYYVSPRLLRPGLVDYCVEAGRLREDYGVRSTVYGDAFAAAGLRRGLDATTTVLGRLELGPTRTLHVGVNTLAGHWGVMSAQAALSHSAVGSGAQTQLRVERQTPGYGWSLGFDASTPDYRRLTDTALPARRASVFAGRPLTLPSGHRVQFGFAGVWQRDHDGRTQSVASLTLSTRLPGQWDGLLSLQSQDGEPTLLVTLTRRFGERGSVGIASQRSQAATQTTLNAQSSAPLAGGLDWRVALTDRPEPRVLAGASWLHDAGSVALDLAHDAATESSAVRFGARGSVVWAGAGFRLARSLDQGSLARVSVPGVAGVPVLHQHRVVAHTDAHGDAWVSGLVPYQNNELAIDVTALPLSMQLDRSARSVRPDARTVVAVVFPVRTTHAALVTVHSADGQPVPAGARATGSGVDAPFGLEGQVYLDNVLAAMALRVDWAGQRCTVQVPLPPPTSELDAPDLAAPDRAATDLAASGLTRIGPLTCVAAP